MEIASIASFLLPTLLSLLSGEGENFFLSSKKPSKNMYGYGYRYPTVPREVKVLYTDPEYRYKWARAAVMNKGIGDRSPWIAFLRKRGTLATIAKELQDAGREYRKLYGVNPKYRSAAVKKKGKIERALTAVQDPRLPDLLKYEFGNKFNPQYINAAVDTLKKELAHLEEIIKFQKEGEQPPPQFILPVAQEQQQLVPSQEKKGSGYGYGLREGLGYGLREGLGYGYGYGYFY